MKYTPARARAAFYQAAEYIEANPQMYDYTKVSVGENCKACMWGHVGRALGFSSNSCIAIVAESVGVETDDLYNYQTDAPGTTKFTTLANPAASRLRVFADGHWPAESTEPVRPDLTECGQSFGELMAEIKGVPA